MIAQARRALAALIPAVGDPPLVPEAGLVLKPQLQAFARVRQPGLAQRLPQAPFLKRSWAALSVLG